jgi:hypothetical protein
VNEPFNECVAAEVVGGIGLCERAETLVRVAKSSLRCWWLRLWKERRVVEEDPLLQTLKRW